MAKWTITAYPDEEDYSAGRKTKTITAKDYNEAINIAWTEFPEYHEVNAFEIKEA